LYLVLIEHTAAIRGLVRLGYWRDILKIKQEVVNKRQKESRRIYNKTTYMF